MEFASVAFESASVRSAYKKHVEANDDGPLYRVASWRVRKAGSGRNRCRVLKAREVWKAILESQTETGTPYMLFKDAANAKSNQQNLGQSLYAEASAAAHHAVTARHHVEAKLHQRVLTLLLLSLLVLCLSPSH